MEKSNLEKLDLRIKWGLLAVSLLTLLGLAAAHLRENVFAEWRQYRSQYAKLLWDKAEDDRGKGIAEQFEVRVVQNYLPGLGKVDRCVTCHAGIDDPRMADQAQPFTTHPGNHVKIHYPERFGCTVCHNGQGRATEADDAHGRVEHWEYPMIDKEFVVATCARCHFEGDLFGEDGYLARASGRGGQAAATAAEKLIARGKEVFETRGCLGCHTRDGKGAGIGPDLTTVGDATRHHFDFSQFAKDEARTVVAWHRKHFQTPSEVIPSTSMPDIIDFDGKDVDALVAYILSMRTKMGSSYEFRRPGQPPVEGISGKALYEKYCISCHGKDGKGGVENRNYAKGTVPPHDTLAEKMFLEYAEDAEYVSDLLAKGVDIDKMSPPLDVDSHARVLAQYRSVVEVIKKGNPAGKKDPEGPTPPLQMPGWDGRMDPEDVKSILAYLLTLYPWEDEEEEGEE